jgi:16S rRNA (guanine527-N7)-methyltransferase
VNARHEGLERLVERWSLPPGAAGRLRALLELLAADPHAPSAVRDPDEALGLHLADSLSLLELGLPRRADEVVDVGSGAGFPGLPLAVARPDCHFDLLEASGRKAEWIRGAADALGLGNVRAVHARAEDHGRGEGRERYALVLARAVASLAVLLEYAAPLLASGGELVAWKGRRDPGEEARAARAAGELGMEAAVVTAVVPFAGARDRHLHVWAKRAPCPPRFPRRPGIAQKRPLGG